MPGKVIEGAFRRRKPVEEPGLEFPWLGEPHPERVGSNVPGFRREEPLRVAWLMRVCDVFRSGL